MITVRIDDHLRVRKVDLPIGHEAAIKERLTIPNGAKAAALKRRQWGAQDLPDSLPLYRDEGPVLVLPRGYASELRAGIEFSGHEMRWDDQTSAPSLRLDQLVHQRPELRPEQKVACQAIFDHRQGVLQATTAAGKTVVVLEAWRRTGLRGLILVEKGGLAKQWIERAQEHLGIDVGLIGEGEWDEKPLTVAMMQTLRRREIEPDWWRTFGFTASDECFPAGTLIDGTPIEEISVGDTVLSFDEQENKLAKRCVKHVFKRHPSSLIRVYIEGRDSIVCTPNHPFFTQHGWIAARDLSDHMVLSSKNGQDHLHVVRQPDRRDDKVAAQLPQGEWARLLLENVQYRVQSENFIGNDGSYQSQIRLRANEGAQSDEEARGTRARVERAQRDWSQAADSRWEWPWAYESTESVVRSAGMADGGNRFDRQREHEGRSTVALQDRYRQSGDEDRYRGRRTIASGPRSAATRSTQDGVLAWSRVDRVEVLQPGRDGRYGGLCPDGLVYNLEVDTTSTYLANGIVVHNCHHLIAETYADVIAHVCSRYLIGVTATPLEGQWEQPLLTNTIGPIFHITTDDTLRRAGRRVAPLIRRVHTGWRWVPANKREANLVDTKVIYRYAIAALERYEARVDVIANTIIAQPAECAQLVVSKRLGYLELLRSFLESGGYEGEIYMMRGSESTDRRTEIAELADAGGCVILATVADEGVDIPRLDRLHLVWPQRKALTITQQIGRVLRSHPDKRSVVIFDYCDDMGMMQSQAQARLRVYRQAGYAVEEERAMKESFTS